MKKIMLVPIVCMALTGCHKKSAAEIAKEKAAEKAAYEEKIKKMYSREETADYILDMRNYCSLSPTHNSSSKKINGNLSLYCRIKGFSLNESNDFLKGRRKSYSMSLTTLKARDNIATGSLECKITSKSLAKKIMDFNVGQYIKIRGKLTDETIKAQFIDKVAETELLDYIGTVSSWTPAKVKYQPMSVDGFISMVNKNPVREMNRLNGHYFTISGRVHKTEGNKQIFAITLDGKESKSLLKRTNSMNVWLDGCKNAQKQVMDSRIKSGSRISVTGKLYWSSASSVPQLVDVNTVTRR